ncbi:telomerase reverse transcriptase KNAG_0C05890 [Huiozyma naganishii CBS 8797]|uniref:Telomerase reverse transcriptase n=1 Tax=Huiozyma naganishii (strain ATCC MYA-139 / BCRC 22969 / CBS 8797 / KCTC 17520 / NBRC 10181 / NCYC 3082 / Yp74L-3) TaxID=1071383 RepID=J7RX93_HUIN7|nr:hypothetical protein KNAG_0C05890 [Kazachstania naganishii CBS 8797]CCK69687.1 hypothetical protein KNAG_0C05890 [Kazachstania naganishii CBS 8797]
MKSLREYYDIEFPEVAVWPIDTQNVPVDNTQILMELRVLTETHFIISNSKQIGEPAIPHPANHKEVLRICVLHLLRNNLYNNILTYGYRLNHSNTGNTLRCTFINTNTNKLMSSVWEVLHNLIGTVAFVHMLINCSVYFCSGGEFVQIVGNRLNQVHCPPSWYISKTAIPKKNRKIGNTLFLYRMNDKPHILPMSEQNAPKLLADLIYEQHVKELPKSHYRNIMTVVTTFLRNYNKNHRYYSILDNICPHDKNAALAEHLALSSPKKQVIKFLTVILDKLLPLSFFGSRRNKSRIFSGVAELVNLPKGGTLTLERLVRGVRMRDIDYLFKPTNTAEAFIFATQLFLQSIFWLFQCLIPKIISSFFYCTEVSSTSDLHFFRQDVWRRVVRPFTTRYFTEYLVENTVCRNHNSYVLSDFNHSSMRVIPKKAAGEFRVLSVPRKGADAEELKEFTINYWKFIAPTQSVLFYLRKKRITCFKKVFSPLQIPTLIKDFKERLLRKHKCLPLLHFMKFDIASCYDSVPRKKALDVLHGALEKENGFYVRSYTCFNSKSRSVKNRLVVNGSEAFLSSDVLIDNCRTTYFTNADILKIVEFELYKTALWVDNKCYLRKDGLFQGSSLSALLVDLIYDDMLETYKEFRCKLKEESLIVRIADDFLIISTDGAQINNIKKLALGGFTEYHATVKREKIVTMDSQSQTETIIQFCAIHIDMQNLEVWKDSAALNVPLVSSNSTMLLYQRLCGIMEMRMLFRTLDGRLNSLGTMHNQIRHFAANLAEIFVIAFRDKAVAITSFSAFLTNVVNSVVLFSCSFEISSGEYARTAKFLIVATFLRVLKQSHNKYNHLITFLNNEQMGYATSASM